VNFKPFKHGTGGVMSKDKAVDKVKDSTFVEMDIGANRRFVVPYPVYKYIIKLKQTRSQVIRDVVEVVKKGMCNYANCSDEDNNQYPDCKIYWDITHPANFVKSGCSIKRINDILEKIKSLEESCNHLKKIYDNDKGFYVECIYCGERSKYTSEKEAMKLKRENIDRRSHE
jgi:hypothetical protein